MEGDRLVGIVPFRYQIISIHSLRMEGDYLQYTRFLSHDISIHSLRMEGDLAFDLF